MSAFVIYAVVLTLIYVLYYTVMLTREMYAAKGQASDTTETFEVGDMDGQISSVSVNETKDGFYLGEEMPVDEDNTAESEELTEVADDNVTIIEPESMTNPSEPTMAEQHAEAVEDGMEDIQPEFSDGFEPDEFDTILLNPANTVPVIITTEVRDEL